MPEHHRQDTDTTEQRRVTSLRAALLCSTAGPCATLSNVGSSSSASDSMAVDIESGSVLHLGTKIYVQSSYTHTDTHLPLCEGGTCIHTGTVNPTSLCCALLYPTIPTTRVLYGSSRGVETLPPYRFFCSSFPLSRTDRGGRGKRRFLFRVGTRKKKRVIDTVQRSPTTFYFFPSLHTRPCSQHVVDWRHVFVKEGKKERGRGGV